MPEQELRYRVPQCSLAGIRRLSALGFYALRKISTLHLSDRYLDTPDALLKQAGYSLRVRSGDGDWLVTLKGAPTGKEVITSRSEAEVQLPKYHLNPSRWPASELRQTILEMLHGSKLEVVTRLRQKRERADVLRGGECIAELSLDRVDLDSGRIYLLECELREKGTRADLTLIDILLQHRFVLEPEYNSKLELANTHSVVGIFSTQKPASSLDTLQARYDIDLAQVEAETSIAERIAGKLLSKDDLTPDFTMLLRATVALRTSLTRLDPACYTEGLRQLASQAIADAPASATFAVAETAALSVGLAFDFDMLANTSAEVQNAVMRAVAYSQLAAALVPSGKRMLELAQVSVKPKLTRLTIMGDGAPAAVRHLSRLDPGITGYLGPRLDVLVRGLRSQSPTAGDGSVQTSHNLIDAGYTYLASLTERFKLNTEAVRTGQDPEAVHDMRVTTRRLHSALVLLRSVLPAELAKASLGLIKTCTGRLGTIRDAEVMLTILQEYVRSAGPTASDVSGLLAEWQSNYDRARSALAAYLAGDDFTGLGASIAEITAICSNAGDINTANQLTRLIDKQHVSLVRIINKYKDRVEELSLEELHGLRIHFKRLRYTLESASEVLKTDTQALDLLAEMQTELGTMHDYSVLLGDVTNRALPAAHSMDDLADSCVLKLSEAYLAFLRLWRRYNNPRFQQQLVNLT